jgi:hypothetical protein
MAGMMHLDPANLDEVARTLRALNKENIDVPQFTVAGHVFIVEADTVDGQMGPERRHVIVDIKPCSGC